MGFFKDMKNMMNSANTLVNSAQQYQNQAVAQQQAATQPYDPNDPSFAPIEGISLDLYAEITAGLLKNGVMGIENVTKFAESKGVPAGAWTTVQNGWVSRMGQSPAVMNRYGHIYNAFLK